MKKGILVGLVACFGLATAANAAITISSTFTDLGNGHTQIRTTFVGGATVFNGTYSATSLAQEFSPVQYVATPSENWPKRFGNPNPPTDIPNDTHFAFNETACVGGDTTKPMFALVGGALSENSDYAGNLAGPGYAFGYGTYLSTNNGNLAVLGAAGQAEIADGFAQLVVPTGTTVYLTATVSDAGVHICACTSVYPLDLRAAHSRIKSPPMLY
jgi:hypothetical protein